jgi:hypothetical protein
MTPAGIGRRGLGLLLVTLLSAPPVNGLAARSAEAAPGRGMPEPTCGALVDAAGAKVNRQTTGKAVGTFSTRRCAEPQRPALPRADIAETSHADPVPDLSADASSPPPLGQSGPLRYAAENPERIGAALVTGSAMIWALHSGLLTSLLLLGVPLWRHVDLLPIVAGNHGADTNRETQPSHEEAAVAHVLENRDTRPRGEPGPA